MTSIFTKSWTYVICAFLLTSQISCKKVSPIAIDNDEVIQTPYSLFLANKSGLITKTNDGKTINDVFPADGYAPLAIETSGETLLMLKDNLHASFNNGKNFQVVYDKVNKMPWEEQLVDVPLQNRIYVTTTQGKGVAYSDNNGLDFVEDTNFNPLMPVNYFITSFAALNDGSVYAFSNLNYLLLKRDNRDAPWNPVTIEGTFPAMDGEYFLTGNGFNLFLIDYSGEQPHYISEDGGLHWRRISNLYIPRETRVNAACQVPGGPLIIGTDERGIYLADSDGFFYEYNGGLLEGTSIKRLTVKRNVYKNGVSKYFIYAASDKGLYRSDDHGYNWVLMTPTTHEFNYCSMH